MNSLIALVVLLTVDLSFYLQWIFFFLLTVDLSFYLQWIFFVTYSGSVFLLTVDVSFYLQWIFDLILELVPFLVLEGCLHAWFAVVARGTAAHLSLFHDLSHFALSGKVLRPVVVGITWREKKEIMIRLSGENKHTMNYAWEE